MILLGNCSFFLRALNFFSLPPKNIAKTEHKKKNTHMATSKSCGKNNCLHLAEDRWKYNHSAHSKTKYLAVSFLHQYIVF